MNRTFYLRYSQFLVALFFSVNAIWAQEHLKGHPWLPNSSDTVRIYPVSNAEARRIFIEKVSPDTHWLQRPAMAARPLPWGHYLRVTVAGEVLIVQAETHVGFGPHILNTRSELAFTVSDTLGRPIQDAICQIAGQRIPFDKKTKCYRLKKWKKGGALEIEVAGVVAFYGLSIDRSNERNYYIDGVRVAGHQPNWLKRKALTFKYRTQIWRSNIARAKRGHKKMAAFFGIKNRKPQDRSYNLQGYAAYSQPKYRPRDTMQVKFWLTDEKGKPWKTPLPFRITTSTGEVKKFTLQPVRPGVFTYAMYLSDSLDIDQHYTIQIQPTLRAKKGLLQHKYTKRYFYNSSFYLEDYVLDELTYAFKCDKYSYLKGDTVRFTMEAKTTNQQAVPDGNYKLVVTSNNITAFFDNEVYVPDTLWRTEGNLDVSGRTELVLPPHLLPNGTYGIAATAYFTNSSGELKTMQANAQVSQTRPPIETKFADGMLKFMATDTALDNRKVKLRIEQVDHQRDTMIALPFALRIQPEMESVQIFNDDKILHNQGLQNLPDGISVYPIQTNDSVAFQIRNPLRIPIQYRIFKEKTMLAEGVADEASFLWQAKTPHRDLWIYYAYTWGGERHSQSQKIDYMENLLTVQLDAPQQVEPGETRQITVQVKDSRNKPAAGAELTAGGYNARFGERKPYSTPQIHDKVGDTPKLYPSWYRPDPMERSFQLPISEHAYQAFELGKMVFYQLRHLGPAGQNALPQAMARALPATTLMPKSTASNNNILQILDCNEAETLMKTDGRPQFAPYIIRGKRAEQIYMIWHNERLVYYHGATHQPPYSFWGTEGYGNNLRLRTRTGEYTLQTVHLTKGKKTLISFYGEGWDGTNRPLLVADDTVSQKALSRAVIRWEPRPDTLTIAEQQVLRSTMLQVRNRDLQGSFFWNRNDNLHELPYNYIYPVIVGPFEANTTLSGFNTNWGRFDFVFEPGYEYLLAPHHERLYASKWPSKLGQLPNSNAATTLVHWAKRLQHLPVPPPVTTTYHYNLTYSYDRKEKATGELLLHVKPDTLLLGFDLTSKKNYYGAYSAANTRVYDLQPGAYTLTLYSKSGKVATKEIWIKKDTTLCLRWDKPLFLAAPDNSRLGKIMYRKDTKWSDAIPQKRVFPKLETGGIDIKSEASYLPDQCVLYMKVVDAETNEELIGTSIKLLHNNTIVKGVVTDVNGEGRIVLQNGQRSGGSMLISEGMVLDIEVAYTGFTTQRWERVIVYNSGQSIQIKCSLVACNTLQAVEILSYKVPLIKQDQTSSGSTLTSETIRSLPTRSVNAIVATIAGVSSLDGGEVNIKGSRSDGTNYYVDGIRVSGGETLAEDYFDRGPLPPGLLRSQFRDMAYFQPTLRTDNQGKATFKVKFPDDITAWNQFAIATDARGRAGFTQSATRALKAVTAQLNVPRFAVAGDQFDLSGRATNSTEDSLLVKTRFLFNKGILKEKTSKIGFGMAEFQRVELPNTTDSAFFTYELQSSNSSDGEMRGIPVRPIGIEETQGQYLAMLRDTAVEWAFDPAKGPVTVVAETNALHVLLQEIEYLRVYPYGCNEQTASKLIGLLTLKKVREWQKKPVDFEPMILQGIKTLSERQLPDGTWGWWKGDNRNWWMTLYVAKALNKAKKLGYAVPCLDQTMPLLRTELPRMHWNDQLLALELLKTSGSDVDCTPYLVRADSLVRRDYRDGIYMRTTHLLNALQLLQYCSKTPDKSTLRQLLLPTFRGGLHVKGEENEWYYRSNTLTLKAYQIAQGEGWNDLTDSIAMYWLSSRQLHYTTFDKAQIVEAVIPSLLRFGQTDEMAQLTVNGVQCTGDRCTFTLPPDQPLRLEKKGTGAIFMNAYQTVFNPQPEPRSIDYEVKTRLFHNASQTASDYLKYGESATLEVTVHAKAGSDYVMIEVPIPAGCTYGPDARYRVPYEVHREKFKDRTAIFCAVLPAGYHTFRIPLESRFTGRFTLNPAKAEQMYFPVFYGRNAVKKVEIRNE